MEEFKAFAIMFGIGIIVLNILFFLLVLRKYFLFKREESKKQLHIEDEKLQADYSISDDVIKDIREKR